MDGKLLSDECFSTLWISGDNYEDYAERFGIAGFEDFSTNVGAYIGREITTLDPILPSRCSGECEWTDHKQISLVRPVNSCLSEEGDLEVRERVIVRKLKEYEPDYNIEVRYKIIGSVTEEACDSFAPSLEGVCKESYLISIGEHGGGGSMGPFVTYNIYGRFELNDGRDLIVPLKNFVNENEALNFVDELAAGQ